MQSERRSLTVMSFNIHRCFGSDGIYSPERIAQIIRQSHCDLIALQEVDSSLEAPNGQNQLSYLADRTGLHAMMGPTLRHSYGVYGNAFLSRWPLVKLDEIDLSHRRLEPRGLLVAELVGFFLDQPLRLYNTHLGLTVFERHVQAKRIASELSKVSGPAILFGDFNDWLPGAPNLRCLAKIFDVQAVQRTFPSRWPRLKLDRIFARQISFESLEVRALRGRLVESSSDHLPLVMKMHRPMNFRREGRSEDLPLMREIMMKGIQAGLQNC